MPQRLAGIDISVYQPIPDPIKLNASGLAFCWVKATEGNTVQSSPFSNQYDSLGKSALLRGPYHFFIPGDDGVTQAKNFAAKANAAYAAGDLPPMIDVETALNGVTPATAIQNLKNCIAQVVADFGVQPVIYTYVPYWKDTLGNPTGFSVSPLWLASYTANPPALVGDWTTITIWQYTAPSGANPQSGFATNIFGPTAYIDGDYFYGSISDLWNLAGLNLIGPSQTYQPKVVALQNQLTAAGYNTNGTDGIFGPATAAALANWQAAKGLPANGTITPEQWMALFNMKYV